MPKSKSKRPPRRRSYAPPPPRKRRKASPKWFGWTVLGVMVVGVVAIVLNYMGLVPGGTSNGWLWAGLGLIAVGFVGATQWR